MKRDDSDEGVDAARVRLEHGDLRGALRRLLDTLEDAPLGKEALAAAAEVAARSGADLERGLFAALAEDPEDPQALYDLGFHLTGAGRPALGARYLELCAARVQGSPFLPLVAYELGYARFLAGDYRAAALLLERSAADDTLSASEAFSAQALLVECRLYAGDLGGAESAFEELERRTGANADDGAQTDALARMLARRGRLKERRELSVRDWHFIEQGGVLLHLPREQETGSASGLVDATVGVDFVAGILRRLETVLTALDRVPGHVQFHPAEMMPVAAAFARKVGATLGPFAPHPSKRTLVMLKDPRFVHSLLAHLREHDEQVDVFALSVDPRQDAPLAPDVVGQFAVALRLPWEERFEVTSGGDGATPTLRHVPKDLAAAARHGDEVLAAMERITDDAEDRRALGRYYSPLKDLVVLGNSEQHPERRMYTARRPH